MFLHHPFCAPPVLALVCGFPAECGNGPFSPLDPWVGHENRESPFKSIPRVFCRHRGRSPVPAPRMKGFPTRDTWSRRTGRLDFVASHPCDGNCKKAGSSTPLRFAQNDSMDGARELFARVGDPGWAHLWTRLYGASQASQDAHEARSFIKTFHRNVREMLYSFQ